MAHEYAPERIFHGFRVVEKGKLELMLEHPVIRGVTPTMIVWWWKNIDNSERFRLWHECHLFFCYEYLAENRGAGTIWNDCVDLRGIKFFNRCRIEVLDENEIRIRCLDIPATILHRFTEMPEGTQTSTKIILGWDWPLIGPLLNALIRSKMRDMANILFKLTIEKFGNLEDFLPGLYDEANASEIIKGEFNG